MRYFLTLVLLAGCHASYEYNCTNGEDDDGDDLVDEDDPECSMNLDPATRRSNGGNNGGSGTQGGNGCCKDCSEESQPCGDTCIDLDLECHTPDGCACW